MDLRGERMRRKCRSKGWLEEEEDELGMGDGWKIMRKFVFGGE